MGMNMLRRARTLFQHRAELAPKVVILHPDLGAAKGSSSKTGGGKQSSNASKPSTDSSSPMSAARFLDDYGHDLVQYDEECTADLHGLVYDTVFGEDDAEYSEGCRRSGMLVGMARFYFLFWEISYTAAAIFVVSLLRIMGAAHLEGAATRLTCILGYRDGWQGLWSRDIHVHAPNTDAALLIRGLPGPCKHQCNT